MVKAAVLGADVRASRSPAIHRAAYRALGIDGTYQALSVIARGFAAAVRRLAREGYAYANVTIPHKRAAATLADTASAAVRASGAANTLIFRRGRIRAENTDGDGLLDALADLGADPRRAPVVVVGAGGAAAGAVHALRTLGAVVRIVARRPAAARLAAAVFPFTGPGLARALDGARIVVSAVPAQAWRPAARLRALTAGLPRGAVVLEMAYGPVSPLAKAVRRAGRRYSDGIPMLVHQAAHAIEAALGRRPPLPPMLRAARAEGPR